MNQFVGDLKQIGSQLELFVDEYLIESCQDLTFKMHEPRLAPKADPSPQGHYMSIVQHNDIFRAYYRIYDPAHTGPRIDGNDGELTCIAQSSEGIHWTLPELNTIQVNGSTKNNVMFRWPPYSHNFSPFRDTNPNVLPDARYKALAGVHPKNEIPGDGLHAFASPDGLSWTMIQPQAVIQNQGFAFDSQNSAFWCPIENAYVCYYRAWKTPHGFLRSINKITSPDFINWNPPIPTNPNLPGEHLYTSQITPYFRAPHIRIALPTRFEPDRGCSTDILLMTTRASNNHFDRLFTEAFIRPGLDPQRWGNRSNYAATGIVPTSPQEISIYHGPAGERYTLRTDGFISIHATRKKGTFTTRPLTFTGSSLTLNVATAASGRVRVEIQDLTGTPIPGRTLDDCDPIFCDKINTTVNWQNNNNLTPLQHQPVRLKFELCEADLYALQFQPALATGQSA